MQMQSDIFSSNGTLDEVELKNQRFKTGGKMDDTYSDALDRTGNRFVAKTLAKFYEGGFARSGGLDQPVGTDPRLLASTIAQNNPVQEEKTPFFKRPGVQQTLFDAAQVGTAVAPSIANIQSLQNLPDTPAAIMQRPVTLDEISADDQIAGIRGATQEANIMAQQISPQAGTQAGMVGRNLAERLKAESRVKGEVNRQNAAIRNQEESINAGIAAQNLQARREAQDERLERDLYRRESLANQRTGLASTLLGVGSGIMGRKSDQMAVDAMREGDTTGSIGRLLDVLGGATSLFG